MIWILRNISLHVWLTVLFAVPFSFYLLPGFNRYFPGIEPLIVVSVTIITVAFIFSVLMDLAARKIITALIKEGAVWERSGISSRAEKNYIKALRIYDTFLLWPLSAKKTAKTLTGAIAKFYLNPQEFDSYSQNHDYKLSALIYLKMNPQDYDIAQLWLTGLRNAEIVTSFEQEILSILAERYYNDKVLSLLILDLFLGLERKDFTAKKLYIHILKNDECKDEYEAKIEALIGKQETKLQQQISFIRHGKKYADKIDIFSIVSSLFKKSFSCLKWVLRNSAAFITFLMLSVVRGYNFVKKHEKTEFYVKICSLILISVGLLFFLNNTVSHIFKSRSIEDKSNTLPQVKISRPFTIQVAAYLKEKYALRYVDILTKKGIDAKIKTISGGGKTWFVVRVSEFEDKKSAAAYGEKLKKQKIIDDFFVNNKIN